MKIVIYKGPHYTEPVVLEYRFDGTIDKAEVEAKARCASDPRISGRRVWVDFQTDSGVATVTHRIYQEGELPPLRSNGIDLTDRVFGKWLVLGRAEAQGSQTKWLCECECGTRKTVFGHDLRHGRSTQCKACSSRRDK